MKVDEVSAFLIRNFYIDSTFLYNFKLVDLHWRIQDYPSVCPWGANPLFCHCYITAINQEKNCPGGGGGGVPT